MNSELYETLRSVQAALRLAATQEPTMITAVQNLRNRAVVAVNQSHENVEATIRDLANTVEGKENEVDKERQTLAELQAKLVQMQNDQQSLHARIEEQNTDKKDLEKELAQLQAQVNELRAMKQKVVHEETKAIPREMKLLQLYFMISGVRWDYDSDHTRGYALTLNETGDETVVPFEFDKATDRVQLSDELWELVSSA